MDPTQPQPDVAQAAIRITSTYTWLESINLHSEDRTRQRMPGHRVTTQLWPQRAYDKLTALASVVSGTHFCFRDLHRSHALLVRVCFRLSVVTTWMRESFGRREDALLSEELVLVLAMDDRRKLGWNIVGQNTNVWLPLTANTVPVSLRSCLLAS